MTMTLKLHEPSWIALIVTKLVPIGNKDPLGGDGANVPPVCGSVSVNKGGAPGKFTIAPDALVELTVMSGRQKSWPMFVFELTVAVNAELLSAVLSSEVEVVTVDVLVISVPPGLFRYDTSSSKLAKLPGGMLARVQVTKPPAGAPQLKGVPLICV